VNDWGKEIQLCIIAVSINRHTHNKLRHHDQQVFRFLLSLAVDLDWVVQLQHAEASAPHPTSAVCYRQLTQQLLHVGQANLATMIGAPHVAVGLFEEARLVASGATGSNCLFARPADPVRPPAGRQSSLLGGALRKPSCNSVALPHVHAALRAGGVWPLQESDAGSVSRAVIRSAWYARYFYSYVDKALDYGNAYVSRHVRVSLSTLWPRLLALARTVGLGPNAATVLQLVCLLLLYLAFAALYATYVLGAVLGFLYGVGFAVRWLCVAAVHSAGPQAWLPSRWQALRNILLGGATMGMLIYLANVLYEGRFVLLGVWQLAARGFAPRLPAWPKGGLSAQNAADKPSPATLGESRNVASTDEAICSCRAGAPVPEPAGVTGDPTVPDALAWSAVTRALQPLPAAVAQALLLTARWEELLLLSPADCEAAARCCREANRLQRLCQICPMPRAAISQPWEQQRQSCGYLTQSNAFGCPLGSERVPSEAGSLIDDAVQASANLSCRTVHSSQPIGQKQAHKLHGILMTGLMHRSNCAERAMSDSDSAFRDRAESQALDFLLLPQWRQWVKQQCSTRNHTSNTYTHSVWQHGPWYGWWFGLTVAQWVGEQCNTQLSLPLRVAIALSVQGMELVHLDTITTAVDCVSGTSCAVALRKGPLLEHLPSPAVTPASGTFLRHVLRWLMKPSSNDPHWMHAMHTRASMRLQRSGVLALFPPGPDFELGGGSTFYCMKSNRILQSHSLCDVPQHLLPTQLQTEPSVYGLSRSSAEAFSARVLGVSNTAGPNQGDFIKGYITVHVRGGALAGTVPAADISDGLRFLLPLSMQNGLNCGLEVLFSERRMQHIWARWGTSNAASAIAACTKQLKFARTAGSTESGSNMAESTSAFDRVSLSVDAAQVHGTSLRHTVSRPLLERQGRQWGHLDRCALELHSDADGSFLGGFVARASVPGDPLVRASRGMPQALFPTGAFGEAVMHLVHGADLPDTAAVAPHIRRLRSMPPRLRQVFTRMGHTCGGYSPTQFEWGVDAACQHTVLGHGWELTPPNCSPGSAAMPEPMWEAFVPIACPPSIAAPFSQLLKHVWSDTPSQPASAGRMQHAAWPTPLSDCTGSNDTTALDRWVNPLLLGLGALPVHSKQARSMCIRLAASTLAYCNQDSIQASRSAADRLQLQLRRLLPAFNCSTSLQMDAQALQQCLTDANHLQRHHLALRRLLGMPWRGWGPFLSEFFLAHDTRQYRLAQQFPLWVPPAFTSNPLKRDARTSRLLAPISSARPSALIAQNSRMQVMHAQREKQAGMGACLYLLLPAAGSAQLFAPDTPAALLDSLAGCGDALRAAINAGVSHWVHTGGWVAAGHTAPNAEEDAAAGAQSHWVPNDTDTPGNPPPPQAQQGFQNDPIEHGHISGPEFGASGEYCSPWMALKSATEATAACSGAFIGTPVAEITIQKDGMTSFQICRQHQHTQSAQGRLGTSKARCTATCSAVDAWLACAAGRQVQQQFAAVNLRRLLLLDGVDQDLLLDCSSCRGHVLGQLKLGIPNDAMAVLPQVPFLGFEPR